MMTRFTELKWRQRSPPGSRVVIYTHGEEAVRGAIRNERIARPPDAIVVLAGLTRPSTSLSAALMKTWMPGVRPGLRTQTLGCLMRRIFST